MKKLEGTSMNIVQDNIEKLKEIFPEIFTEEKIDFEVLKQLLGEKIETDKERYSFTWKGKTEARQVAQDTSTGTLRPYKKDSKDWDNTENLYIEGDNLEILKLLQKSYHGKIKMIYIDPPYNTGNDFIYPDNYRDNIKNYLKITGQIGEKGEKLSANLETDGSYHSRWLNMMYPRLKIARDILTNDGVIFISIDDNELFNLKKMCDEIFGENNFIEIFSWKKSATPPNLSKKSKKNLEYILCYQKQENDLKFKGIKKESSSNNGLLNQTNKFTKLIFPKEVVETKLSDRKIKSGIYGTDNYEIILHNDIECKNGIFITPIEMSAKFKWSQKKLETELAQGTIISMKTESLSPSYEKKEYEPEVPANLIDLTVGVDTTENAGKNLTALFNQKVFDYPKPVSLLKYLINFTSNKEDIILDFFSGSATTAHAVMELNAEDGGNRKYIMVQLPEPCKEESAIYKSGYKNICEIGKERIRRAGKKIKSDENFSLENREKLDIGFKVFKLDSSNIKEWDSETNNLKQMLLDSIDNIKPDRSSLDVLYEILLKYGLDLNVSIEEKVNFYSIGGGTLLVNLDKEINMDIVDSICEEYRNLLEIDEDFKTTVVLRDSAFKNDVDKTNAMKKLEQVGIKEVRSI